MAASKSGIGQAVDAMRAGASDFLVRPVAPERLQQALRSATRRSHKGQARATTAGPNKK